MQNFSVLMSLYHKEKPDYLRKALDSVFGNSIKPEQVVMVLDGPIGEELMAVVEEYKRLIFSNVNAGNLFVVFVVTFVPVRF